MAFPVVPAPIRWGTSAVQHGVGELAQDAARFSSVPGASGWGTEKVAARGGGSETGISLKCRALPTCGCTCWLLATITVVSSAMDLDLHPSLHPLADAANPVLRTIKGNR